MQDADLLKKMLADHGLRNTDFRREVLQILKSHQGIAIATPDIEERLGYFDRITLYRTIKTFIDKGLVHQTIDNDGQTKYALCDTHCDEHAHHDDHAHFKCDACKRTLCIPVPVQIAKIDIPAGYQVGQVTVNLTGICEQCA
jgi:Fur family ferric uptake transcriptional regulator